MFKAIINYKIITLTKLINTKTIMITISLIVPIYNQNTRNNEITKMWEVLHLS